MNTDYMFKSKVLSVITVFFSICFSLNAQDLEKRVSQVESNVVWINANSSNTGFGFIVGQKEDTFYIVTAYHVVAPEDSLKPTIDVFIKSKEKFPAKLEHKEETEDLALISIKMPSGYRWLKGCVAFEDPKVQEIPSFIAWADQWETYPVNHKIGRIAKIVNPIINFQHQNVKPGASGAPLITDKGIIGMILTDEGAGSRALSIKKIKELIQNYKAVYQLEPLNLREQMVFIPSVESFKIGSDLGASNAQPAHMVKLNSFYLDQYELSVKDYSEYLKYYDKRNPFSKIGPDQPVHNVSWLEAIQFCNWLSVKEGYEEFYTIDEKDGTITTKGESNSGYRLPTEAEWEYAASGGKSTNDQSFLTPKPKKIQNVQQGKINEFSLVNMMGNVAEWCWDYYSEIEYQNRPYKSVNPSGPMKGSKRVVRGSTWENEDNIKIYTRNAYPPDSKYPTIGFRLARNAN